MKKSTVAIIALAVIFFSAAVALADIIPGQNLASLKLEKEGGGKIVLGKIGKPAMIAFFFPGGKEDAKQLRAAQALVNKHKNYEFIAVTRGKDADEKKSAADFLDKTKVKAVLAFDQKSDVTIELGVLSLPSFVIVDQDGILRTLPLSTVTEKPRKLSVDQMMELAARLETIPFVDLVENNTEAKESLRLVGRNAPELSLPTYDNRNYKLSWPKNRNTILIFWSIGCPHCLKELPKMQSFSNNYRGDYGFDVVTVTRAGDSKGRSSLRDIVRENVFTFPILLDEKGDATKKYGVKFVPSVFIIDKKGKIVDFLSGENPYFAQVYHSIFRDPQRFGK
ncbi:MAG TPA: TlpA family protein disulfide reductase [bacterium]|nr:TlpA family protein disulfide reductase [bacterium]